MKLVCTAHRERRFEAYRDKKVVRIIEQSSHGYVPRRHQGHSKIRPALEAGRPGVLHGGRHDGDSQCALSGFGYSQVDMGGLIEDCADLDEISLLSMSWIFEHMMPSVAQGLGLTRLIAGGFKGGNLGIGPVSCADRDVDCRGSWQRYYVTYGMYLCTRVEPPAGRVK